MKNKHFNSVKYPRFVTLTFKMCVTRFYIQSTMNRIAAENLCRSLLSAACSHLKYQFILIKGFSDSVLGDVVEREKDAR